MKMKAGTWLRLPQRLRLRLLNAKRIEQKNEQR